MTVDETQEPLETEQQDDTDDASSWVLPVLNVTVDGHQYRFVEGQWEGPEERGKSMLDAALMHIRMSNSAVVPPHYALNEYLTGLAKSDPDYVQYTPVEIPPIPDDIII